jgi:hypothetical protein
VNWRQKSSEGVGDIFGEKTTPILYDGYRSGVRIPL